MLLFPCRVVASKHLIGTYYLETTTLLTTTSISGTVLHGPFFLGGWLVNCLEFAGYQLTVIR
jgi:hypothetical protein